MNHRIAKGILAGFVATVALSAMMVLKAKMGMLPQVNAIKMLSTMAHGFTGTPLTPVVRRMLHFIIGSVMWGTLFALLFDRIPSQVLLLKVCHSGRQHGF